MDDSRVQQLIDAIQRLKKLNRDIWSFLPRLRDGMAKT
jgi:hypothetical protein